MNIYLALPVMNEPEVLMTINSILSQTQKATGLFICINQPESFRTDPEKKYIYEQNQKTLQELSDFATKSPIKISIIDKSSENQGWDSVNHGVGWARKVLMDEINKIADNDDIIVSLDADTFYPQTYLESVKAIFQKDKDIIALSNPYYHRLTGDKAIDQAILRYEIYMRFYYLNLKRIQSPYLFTALGSAIALRVKGYRRIGGISPKKSGEDFYLLQQLVKTGKITTENTVTVYPASRLSNRVFFGTGPALIKGVDDNWESYPVYPPKYWDEINLLYSKFLTLKNDSNVDIGCVEMNIFASDIFTPEIWNNFRKNAKTDAQFLKFCHEKFDGLRILQYLKQRHNQNPQSEEQNIRENCIQFGISDYNSFEELRDILYNLS